MTVGHRIKLARKALGISQGQLAEIVGTNQVAVSNWENDVYRPNVEKMRMLANALKVPPHEIAPDTFPNTSEDGDATVVKVFDFILTKDVDGTHQPHRLTKSEGWPFPIEYVRKLVSDPVELGIHEVVGDSMEVTFKAGDKVLVNFTKRNPAVPGLYVIAQGGEPVVQRIDPIPGTNPLMLCLRSDNDKHGTHQAAAQDIEIIGWIETKISRIG